MLIISSVVMEDCLYTYAITKPQHIINRYDPLTNRWDWYPLKQDYNAIHVCMTTLNGLIYLIGNEKCCTFDPESQKIEMVNGPTVLRGVVSLFKFHFCFTHLYRLRLWKACAAKILFRVVKVSL